MGEKVSFSDWEPCLRCGSKRVEKDPGAGSMFWVGVCLISTGIMLVWCLPFIGVPLIIIGAILMLLAIVGGGLMAFVTFQKKKITSLTCQDCKYHWYMQVDLKTMEKIEDF